MNGSGVWQDGRWRAVATQPGAFPLAGDPGADSPWPFVLGLIAAMGAVLAVAEWSMRRQGPRSGAE